MHKHAGDHGFPEPGHDHGSCVSDMLERAGQAFAAHGLRMTPLRKRVLETIAASHSAVGAYDLLEKLAKPGERRLAPISVYRALDSLVEAGLVHRLESRNAFFACHATHASDRRQVVLACSKCGTVAELAGERVFPAIAAIAVEAGFAMERVMVEVIGLCDPCRSAASAGNVHA